MTRAGGGIANNIVPAEFRLNLNYRFPPSLSVAQAEQRLRELAAPADEVVIRDFAPSGAIPEGNKHLLRLEVERQRVERAFAAEHHVSVGDVVRVVPTVL